MVHDGMPYDPAKGQGQGQHHGCLKVGMVDFKVISFAGMRVIKRLNGEL